MSILNRLFMRIWNFSGDRRGDPRLSPTRISKLRSTDYFCSSSLSLSAAF
jgi:hypothetical protein